MRGVLLLLALAVGLVTAGPVAVASAQAGGDGLQELWRQYPLAPSSTETVPRATAKPPVSGSADSTSKAAPPAPRLPRAQSTPSAGPDARTILLGTGVIALAAAAAAVVLVRRRRPRAPARRRPRRSPAVRAATADAPATTASTYVQGVTERNGIGGFEGFVAAQAIAPPPLTEPLYLVRDARREQPVWVRRSEVRELQTVDAAAAGPEATER